MALVYDLMHAAQGMPPVNQDIYSHSPWFDVETLATPPYTPLQYPASLQSESPASSDISSLLRRSPAMRYRSKPFGPRSQGSQRHKRPNSSIPGSTANASSYVSLAPTPSNEAESEQIQTRGAGGNILPQAGPSRPRAFALFDEPNYEEQEAHRLSSLYSLSSPHSPESSSQMPIHSSLMESLVKAPMLPLLINTARRSQRSRSNPHISNNPVTSSTPRAPFGRSSMQELVESPVDIHVSPGPHSQSSSMFLLPSAGCYHQRRESSLEIDITDDIMELLSGLDFNQRFDTTPRQVTTAPCLICFDVPSQFPDLPPTSECTHAPTICGSCLEKHISHSVQSQGSTTLTCPDPECRREMEYQDVVRGAKGDQACLDRYEALLLRRTLENDPNCVWCKNPACGWGQIHDGGATTPIVTCQACKSLSCFTHDMPWHVGLTCEQYAIMIRKADEASEAYIDKHAKVCPNPNCGRRIEKAEGCDHMTCRRPAGCGHEFCWICLADYDVIRREGDHQHKSSCIHYAPPRSNTLNAHFPPHVFHGLDAMPEEPAPQPVFRPLVEHQPRFNPFGSVLPAFLQRYHPPRFNRRPVDRAQV